MRRFAILAALALLLAPSACAQEPVPPSKLKPCSQTNPPPCLTAPKLIHRVDPSYSKEARADKIEGIVVLYLIVGVDGKPRDIRVARSIGHGLDEKAIEAVRKWRFAPSTDNGTPVPVAINVEVNFHLY
jgi:TonB family protein